MEEWSLKLKLLHWMMIERADGVSPLICFDDDGGGDGGGDGGDGGDDDGGEDGGEGADGFEGGDDAGEDGGDDAGEDGADGADGGEEEGATDGATSDAGASPESDFEFDAASGYADYGSLGGAQQEQQDQQGPTQDQASLTPDINAASPFDPSTATPAGPSLDDLFEQLGKEQQDKEKEKEDDKDKPSYAPPAPPSAPMTIELSARSASPTTAQSPGVPQEFYGKDGPLTDPNKDQSQPTFDYLPGIDAPPAQQGAPQGTLADYITSSPYDQQQSAQASPTQDIWETGAPPFDTLGVAAPTVDNPAAVGSLSAQGVPGYDFGVPGAVASQLSGQPSGQQTASNKDDREALFDMPPSANPVQTVSFTPPAAFAPTPSNREAKSDREVREGRLDPFAPDKPDIWDPNAFGPPVGMMMSNIPSMPASPAWDPQTASPFGPQAPTQASPQVAQVPQGQAPPYDPTIFDPASMQSQAPPSLWDIAPTQQQTPPAVASREERERERQENRDPLTVAQAPAPSQIIDTGARYDRPELSTVPAPTVTAQPTPEPPAAPPGRSGTVSVATQDAHGNTAVPASYAPDPQAGNPLAGGPPAGATVELPSSPTIGDGGLIPPPQRQQLSARRRLNQTDQQRRDAITEALMRRDLNAPGVSDFDRLRLQP